MTAGIIERYAAYLPVTPRTPRITLGEGSTPLVRHPLMPRDAGFAPSSSCPRAA
jgi:threonine synthase